MKMSVEKNTNSSDAPHYSPEEVLSFNAGVVSPQNEIKLVNGVTGEAERNMTVLLHAKNMYTRPLFCEIALFPGEQCHPHRYNGTIGRSNAQPYSSLVARTTCPYIMPCEPSTACTGNGKCAFGYISYYNPYRNDGLCDPLHYTLPDSTCFAPRCGLCDISEERAPF